MNVPQYVDQSAAGLRFYLVQGEVDTEQFDVLSRQVLACCTYSVEAGIIGASHFLKVQSGEVCLSEIFACTTLATKHPLVSSGPLADLLSTIESLTALGKYTFTPRLLAWSEGANELQDLLAATIKARAAKNQLGLQFRFASANQTGPAPCTLVWAEGQAKQLLVRTAHSYPNEEKIVFTETNLTLKGTL